MRFLSAFLVALAVSSAAIGREPAEEFVKGLQQRGLHDLANEYLEGLKTSPLADDALRQQIPYLRGVALIEQSRRSTEPAVRNKFLDDARQELEKFAETNPNSVTGAEAQLQLASVQLARGQELAAQAGQLPKDATYDAQRRSQGREARVMFAEAREMFGRAEAIYSSELEKLPPTSSNEARGDTGSKRQEYRARVAQLRFLAAQTRYEEAQSYPAEADEFRKLNETAAQELSAIYDEFARTLLVGLYARLYEGRCYQSIGKYQEALGCYEEIIGKDNVLPPFRKLIASAVQRKAEVLTAQDKMDAAIEACRLCLKNAHKDEEKQPEWLAVRFQLAKALAKKSESAAAESTEQRKLLVEARDAYRTVSKSPGEFQVAARLASTTGGGSKGSSGKEKDEPKTFQAAYDLGKEALTSYNTAKMALPTAEKNNPDAVPDLKAQMEQGKEDARNYFRLASTLVESDTDPKVLNELRYFLCWLYWESEDYFRAAVLGEFLARRYPEHPAASSSAKIAMASFERLYNTAVAGGGKVGAGDFEAGQLAHMAELITKRWPGTEDANAAFAVLVSTAIRTGRIEDAEKLLGQASAQSRPRLELQLGNAMWGRYLELSQGMGQQTAPNPATSEKIRVAAVKHLRSGFEALRKESPVSELIAMAALYLAQASLADGNYEEAIATLNDKDVGPLTLVEKEHATASRSQYAIEAYKAALRAYVSVSPPQEEKAMETMKSLERVAKAGDDAAKAADQLNRIYIGMGVTLQKQIEELRAAGKNVEAKRVSSAVATFLDRIAAQQGESNWATRVWLAQTYYAMANDQQPQAQQGAGTAAQPFGAVAKVYLTKSRDAYKQLLKEAADDPKLPPNDTAVLAAKMQLGECYRALGQFQPALDMFSEVLREKEASLAVQRVAALTYQERGQKEDAIYLENAIKGGIKLKSTGQNRIWGWIKISTVAARASKTDDKFKDSFFEARYNIGRCRYLAAMKKTGAARQQDLTSAKQGVFSLGQLYPGLGGERWKPQFEQLLKDIEREEDKKQPSADAA